VWRLRSHPAPTLLSCSAGETPPDGTDGADAKENAMFDLTLSLFDFTAEQIERRKKIIILTILTFIALC
jgi:hypothetical protein